MNFELSPESLAQFEEPPQKAPEPTPAPTPKPAEPAKAPEVTPAPAPAEEPKSLKERMEFKPTEEEPTVPEIDEKEISPKNADNIRALREQHKQAVAELKALKRKLGDGSPDVETLRQERDNLAKELRMARAEKSPEFQKEWENKFAPKVALAETLAGAEGRKLASLLKQSPSESRDAAIEEIRDNLTPAKQGRLDAVLNEIDQLHVSRDSEIANLHQEWEKRMKEDGQNAQLKQLEATQRSAQVFDTVLKTAAGEMEIFRELEGNAEHNRAVSERLELAKAIYSGTLNEVELATASLWASAAEGIMDAYRASQQEVASLQAKVDELTKGVGTPGGIDTSQAGKSGQVYGFDSPMKPGESYPEYLARVTNEM